MEKEILRLVMKDNLDVAVISITIRWLLKSFFSTVPAKTMENENEEEVAHKNANRKGKGKKSKKVTSERFLKDEASILGILKQKIGIPVLYIHIPSFPSLYL